MRLEVVEPVEVVPGDAADAEVDPVLSERLEVFLQVCLDEVRLDDEEDEGFFASILGRSKAQKKKNEALRMLADKEHYVAHFYFIREFYESALGRYEDLIKKYPDSGLLKKAYYGATVSAYRAKEFDKARLYFQKLAKAFPKADETKEARSELENGK